MMDVEFPAIYCIICQDFREGDGKTLTEKSLTSLTVHIQTYKCKKGMILLFHTYILGFMMPGVYITYDTQFYTNHLTPC
jgi:hypothetical protein